MQTKQQFEEDLKKAFINAVNTCRMSADALDAVYKEYVDSDREFEPEGECESKEQALYDQETYRYYRYAVMQQLSLVAGAITGLDSLIQNRHDALRVEGYLSLKKPR